MAAARHQPHPRTGRSRPLRPPSPAPRDRIALRSAASCPAPGSLRRRTRELEPCTDPVGHRSAELGLNRGEGRRTPGAWATGARACRKRRSRDVRSRNHVTLIRTAGGPVEMLATPTLGPVPDGAGRALYELRLSADARPTRPMAANALWWGAAAVTGRGGPWAFK